MGKDVVGRLGEKNGILGRGFLYIWLAFAYVVRICK